MARTDDVLVRVERQHHEPVHESILLRQWMASITENRLEEFAPVMERDLRRHYGIQVRSPADPRDVYVVRLKGTRCPDCGHIA